MLSSSRFSPPGLLDSAILFGPVSNADATSFVRNPKEEVGCLPENRTCRGSSQWLIRGGQEALCPFSHALLLHLFIYVSNILKNLLKHLCFCILGAAIERNGKDPHVWHRLSARSLEMICLVYVVGRISGVWFCGFWFLS